MVKISKVMPQSHVRSPGKGGKPYGKSPKILRLIMVRLNRTLYSHLTIYGLTVHISQNFQFFKIVPSQSPRITQNSHIL